jgi:hypothetical protein
MLRIMKKTIILENGSRDEACRKFDEVKKSIVDYSIETVSIQGNIRQSDEGWKVIRISY